ncbi:MAG: acylphosphatase [Thermotogae bacterium]|nr:acylphosphatase [Thermotogota bacterium]
MEKGKIALEIRVYGIVQGVGFRSFARRKAYENGIKGYVRNLSNGSVEIIAEGDRKSLNRFLIEISRGPIFAQVERVEKKEIPFKGFESFDIRF